MVNPSETGESWSNKLPLTRVVSSDLPDKITEETSNTLYLDLDSVDTTTLDKAYEYCRQIIKHGSKGFYFSTLFLPLEQRRAMWAIYNFCRYTDDMVDRAQVNTRAELDAHLSAWETELRHSFEGKVYTNRFQMLAWQHTAHTFKIPLTPPLELIKGMRMDLTKSRYANYEALRLYCYRVASTVGLMAAEVIGYSDPGALDYATELGIGMQLTNILRDIGEDAKIGRIYLPQDEMANFGYTEEELLGGVINERFIKLMQFQIARSRGCYKRALPGIEFLHKDSRLAITVAAEQYSRILDAIERNQYDVFNQRAYVTLTGKLKCVAQVWTRRQFQSRPIPLSHTEIQSQGKFAPILFTYDNEGF
ncbi:MAG: squalene/phytoene synthase family protein [Chloroflexota bacterium]